MKRIICISVLCILCCSMHSQDMFSYSVEVDAGIGFKRGPLASVSPQFVAQYNTDNSFILGAGAGARFAFPCLTYDIRNGKHSREFCDEFDIPVFVRLGYGNEKFRAFIDAGYAVGLLSFYSLDWHPGGRIEGRYNGFFIEPQIGFKTKENRAIALGLILQQSTVTDRTTVTTPDESRTISHTRNIFTPAITFRYSFNL